MPGLIVRFAKWRTPQGVPCRVFDPTYLHAPRDRWPDPRCADGPHRVTRPLCILAVLSIAIPAFAADWPQFLGPNRDGVYTATTLPTPGRPQGRHKFGKGRLAKGLATP